MKRVSVSKAVRFKRFPPPFPAIGKGGGATNCAKGAASPAGTGYSTGCARCRCRRHSLPAPDSRSFPWVMALDLSYRTYRTAPSPAGFASPAPKEPSLGLRAGQSRRARQKPRSRGRQSRRQRARTSNAARRHQRVCRKAFNEFASWREPTNPPFNLFNLNLTTGERRAAQSRALAHALFLMASRRDPRGLALTAFTGKQGQNGMNCPPHKFLPARFNMPGPLNNRKEG